MSAENSREECCLVACLRPQSDRSGSLFGTVEGNLVGAEEAEAVPIHRHGIPRICNW